MSIDQRTTLITQIAAAAAANAMPALRLAVTAALADGFGKEEIQAILDLATEIQQQPASHTFHLAKQLLREPAKKSSTPHSAGCSCGHC
jgi:alkylhydroperoxidase/carboxymuconolactone decarboxylase family protein YurZ